MQPLSWYARRLRGMAPAEIAWRVKGVVRDALDRPRFALGLVPGAPAANAPPGWEVADVAVGEWKDAAGPEAAWCARLRTYADAVASGRLHVFDHERLFLGAPPDWNRDHDAGVPAPMGFAPAIDYRDYSVTGDAKLVWEPSRHHQLVVLGRAYRATGERRYAEALVGQMESWWDACPFGRGMQWRSPLELAIRLINWVYAVDLVRPSGLVAGRFAERLLHSARLHAWEVARKYSRGSSANNHLIGEAAGVFVAASYFTALDPGGALANEAQAVLAHEVHAQTDDDGGGREQAFGYQLFVLQFLLCAGVAARRRGRDFPPAYWQRVETMLAFVAALEEAGPAPFFGDADDGYVLDLGARADARALLSTGAALFGRADFAAIAGALAEDTRWLLGRTGADAFAAAARGSAPAALASRALPASGLYLLQSGARGGADAVSVVLDCGELGFGAIAAHGHADALSFTVRAFGGDVLVDPGTYDYFKHPDWRRYFRTTRAHNALEVDGLDQSVIEGPFLWGTRAQARCLSFAPSATGGAVTADHDGYRRLPDPVLHRRRLHLDGRTLEIHDAVEARDAHDVALYFHLAEDAQATLAGARVEIALPRGSAVLELDPALSVGAVHGSESPILGWVSRGYHRKTPSTTIVARAATRGAAAFTCRLTLLPR